METNEGKSKVYLTPWVGENYGKESSIFQEKLMVLTGSHYEAFADKCNENYEEYLKGNRTEASDFTNSIVEIYLGLRKSDLKNDWEKTYSSFINAIFNRNSSEKEKGLFFDSIVFYTYLQRMAGKNAKEAELYNYKCQEYIDAFLEVIKKYKPEVIICWGAKVREALLGKKQGLVGNISIEEVTVRKNQTICTLEIDARKIKLIMVRHPSRCFGRKSNHEIFKRFLTFK